MLKTALGLLLLFHCCIANAQEDIAVIYNPTGNLSLGKSIDINNPLATKPQPFTYAGTKWIDGGSPNTSLKASLVTSTNELFSKLNLDYNYKGSVKIPIYGGGSGEFDAKYELVKEYSDNNLYYVVQAYNDFGREEMLSPVLEPSLQALLVEHKFDDFIRRAGTHYVARQRRASNLFALITISKLNSVTKKSLSAKYSSEVNMSIPKVADLSAKETVTFSNFIKTAYKFGSVNIEYYSSGTAGLSQLAQGFPESPDDLKSILKALALATESVSKENSTPVEYYLASFEPYGLDSPDPDFKKSECISKLNDRKVVLGSYLNRVRKIVLDQRNAQFRPYYEQRIRMLEERLNVIKEIEKRCKERGDCCSSNLQEDGIYWLEDIMSISTAEVVVDFAPAYRENGTKAGRIIKSLRLVVTGHLPNAEYFRDMDGYFLNADLDPVKIDLPVLGNTNPSLSEVEQNGVFKERNFLFVIDNLNIDYQSGPDNRILFNSVNLDKLNASIEMLKRRSYFVEILSSDNLKYYVDLPLFEFSNFITFHPE